MSSSSKRHFTAVVGSKEHGLYNSSSPSSAARKIVSKLCAVSKSKKVEFYVREITKGSKKKTYGPYLGEMKKNKFVIHLKKEKSDKIIRGGRVERFGIIELSDFIQKQNNKDKFAIIKKNYFRKPYLFFNPIMNPKSGTYYYTYMAYETFLFRKAVIKQIKNNQIVDVDDIMNISVDILEKLHKFIQENNIFSNLKIKIEKTIETKKKGIDTLKNKQYVSKLQNRIKKQKQQAAAAEAAEAEAAEAASSSSIEQPQPQQQQPQQQQQAQKSNNSTNKKIIEIKTIINLNINESFKATINCYFKTRKPYHTSKNDCDIIIKKYSENYYIFFIIEQFPELFYRYVLYYKDSRIIFKKLNDNLLIETIDIKSINIEILLFLLNFLDTLLKESKNDTKKLILTNIHTVVLKEVNIKLKELYPSNNNVNYKKINYSIFENMNNISNTKQLIRDGFFIQNLNKNNNNVVITKSDIRGKIWKMDDTTYIFFSPIPLLELINKNTYYYNFCVYEHSGNVKFKKVYKDKQSIIKTEDITMDNIKTEDLNKLIDFILYKNEYRKYKNICNDVIKFLIDERTLDNNEIDKYIYTFKKLKELFDKEPQLKPSFYNKINEKIKAKIRNSK